MGQGGVAGFELTDAPDGLEPLEGQGGTLARPDRHILLLADQALWHLSGGIVLARDMAVLPPWRKFRELNVLENVSPFMGDKRLSKRVCRHHDDILAQGCHE